MRALLCTNHLVMWSGSELVIIELADELRRRGAHVQLLANVVSPRLRSALQTCGHAVSEQPEQFRAFDFDLVWNQHHMACLLDFTLDARSRPATRFVYSHLSPFEPLEQPGFVAESILADLVVCNSPETENMVVDLDLSRIPRRVMPNPAPRMFASARRLRDRSGPRQIAVISNHPPAEVMEALSILQAHHGIRALRIGLNGDRYERLSPELLGECDAVISIGKTIPYCLLAGVPVFCYDRFGGPGYLSPENFASAEAMNFSGRCCHKRLDANAIVAELIQEYSGAVSGLSQEVPERFQLEPHLDQILASSVEANQHKRAGLDAQWHRLRREVAMAKIIRGNLRGTTGP